MGISEDMVNTRGSDKKKPPKKGGNGKKPVNGPSGGGNKNGGASSSAPPDPPPSPPSEEDPFANAVSLTDLLGGLLAGNANLSFRFAEMEDDDDDDEYLPPSKRKKPNKDNNPALSTYDKDHAKYYNALAPERKSEIAKLERELEKDIKTDGSLVPNRFRLLESGVTRDVKLTVMARTESLFRRDAHPSEKAKMSKWLDAFLRIPFGVRKPIPVDHMSDRKKIQKFVQTTKDKLDSNIHGHTQAKDQIIRTLAKWISNPSSRGNVIGLQGPMGCGKTTLVKNCIAEALGLPLAMVPLGGVTDSSVFTGHLYTYEGSTYGSIVNCLMSTKCMNPVILFDELDKVGGDSHRGQEVYNTLIHLTDPVQNERFIDHYFADIPIDMSKALMVFTFNHMENINPILRDRMSIIKTPGYNLTDKKAIAQTHLLPKILKQYGLQDSGITITEEAIFEITARVDQESGVRNLERAIDTIVGNINLQQMMNNEPPPEKIERDQVIEYIQDNRSDKCSVEHIYL